MKRDTIDWLSIYRHGHDGEAENPWSYVFLSFFRGDVGAIRNDLRKPTYGYDFGGNVELAALPKIKLNHTWQRLILDH